MRLRDKMVLKITCGPGVFSCYSVCPHSLLGRYFIRAFGSVISMKYFRKHKISVHPTLLSCVV